VVGFGEDVELDVAAAGVEALPELEDFGRVVGAVDGGIVDPFRNIPDCALVGSHGAEMRILCPRLTVFNDSLNC
jgi:hypothetical protein